MSKKARKRSARPAPSAALPVVSIPWKVPASIILLCAVLYGWTLRFPMVFDDDTYLINNPFFTAESFSYPLRFHEFVNAPKQMGLDPDLAINFVTRPVSYATFLLNYQIGGWNTTGFRLLNILIHTASSVLLWGVLRILLRRLAKAGSIRDGSASFIPAAAAMLFAVHPLAIESVTYIVQRFTSFAAFWSLLAAWLYFRSTEDGIEKSRLFRLRASAAVVMLLGMLTKECAFVTPLLIVMLDLLVLGTAWRTALRRAMPVLVTLPVVPVLVLMTSASLNGGSLDLGAGLNIVNSRDEPVTHLHYLLTQFGVIAHYLRLMIWPSGQNIDPAWPVQSSLLSLPVILPLLLHLGLLTLAVLGFRRWRQTDGRVRLVLAFTAWFYLGISISSGLVPLPDMVAEHRAYLPSAGIFIVLACLFDLLRERLASRPLLLHALATVIVLGLSTATVLRNLVWSGADALWADASEKSPGKHRVWSNLGVALAAKGREKEAVECYRKSVKIEPAFSNGVLNLSNSLLRLGQPKEAISEIERLRDHNPGAVDLPAMQYTKALGLFQMGHINEATSLLRGILVKDQSNFMAHRLLGMICLETGGKQEAEIHLRRAFELNSGDRAVRKALEQAGLVVTNDS